MIELLTAAKPWAVVKADAVAFLRALPADSIDLIFTSPPYVAARLYLEDGQDLGIAREAEAWVAWMVELFRECVRVCKGLTAFVVEGQTRKYRYDCAPDLLRADLCRAGFNLRKSPIYQRVGIPGSGGPDWLRNDYEPIVCVTRPGKLPWSDNTAMGHPPKWAPGGEMSHRLSSGQRVNQWGRPAGTEYAQRQKGGKRQKADRPSHTIITRRATRGKANGDTRAEDSYTPPAIANPGNVIRCKVGGNLLGSKLAHDNEAPFPESLAEFFVLSFCPPGGLVCDPFSGSGTTAAVSVRHGRRFVGCDVRQSQVDLACRRVAGETPLLFTGAEGEEPSC